MREPQRVGNARPATLRTFCKTKNIPPPVDRPNPVRGGDGIFYTLVAPPFTPSRSHPASANAEHPRRPERLLRQQPPPGGITESAPAMTSALIRR
jgi:hypothetical protein